MQDRHRVVRNQNINEESLGVEESVKKEGPLERFKLMLVLAVEELRFVYSLRYASKMLNGALSGPDNRVVTPVGCKENLCLALTSFSASYNMLNMTESEYTIRLLKF